VLFVRSQANVTGHLFFLRDETLLAQPFDADRMALTGGSDSSGLARRIR
jgi:hypothetical protein